MKLQPGTLLQNGKYRIEGVLGQGGFGITYLAEHTSLKSKVCIKEFYPQSLCSRNESGSVTTVSDSTMRDYDIFKRRFLDEARKLHAIHHEHIVTVSDLFEENMTAYYVMEYIKGETLKAKIDRMGALSEEDARRYIGQVADALSYIHSLDMLHLDIKPANIMLRASDDRVVVIDFGLARHYDSKTGEQTTTYILAHSPGYAPFEQSLHDSSNHLSPASDIYALGATLCAIVTGKRPPEAAAIPSDGLPTLPTHLSEPLREAIVRAMEYSIKRRPQSIAEFKTIFNGNKIDNGERTDNGNSKKTSLLFWVVFVIIILGGLYYYLKDKDIPPKPIDYTITREVVEKGDTLMEYVNNYFGYGFKCPTYMKVESESLDSVHLVSEDGKTELFVNVDIIKNKSLKDRQILYNIQESYEKRFRKDKNKYFAPQKIESIDDWIVASGYLTDEICLYNKSVLTTRLNKDGESERLIVSITVQTESKEAGIIAYHIRDYFVVNETGTIK